MGGSNEFVECFCWGAVAEGGSGAVVRLVGDGVEVGLVAGDGGSCGQVAADEPVGVFVGPLSQDLTAFSSAPGPANAGVGSPAQTRNGGFVCNTAGSRASGARGQAPHRPYPRSHRQRTGGFAPLGERHAGDTPWRGS